MKIESKMLATLRQVALTFEANNGSEQYALDEVNEVIRLAEEQGITANFEDCF